MGLRSIVANPRLLRKSKIKNYLISKINNKDSNNRRIGSKI